VIRFVLGLAGVVFVVVMLARFLGSQPADLVPDLPAVSTASETCEATGGKAIVRTLPDGTVEGVSCR
jgi:hypothetical protein